jgi:hypothetical protein
VIHDGYVARWRGTEYEASPDGDLVRLYTTAPEPGFEAVDAGRFRLVVPRAEVDWSGYLRTTGVWRGLPVLVLAEHGDRWLVAVFGGRDPGGFTPAEQGVHLAWRPREEVGEVRETRLPD